MQCAVELCLNCSLPLILHSRLWLLMSSLSCPAKHDISQSFAPPTKLSRRNFARFSISLPHNRMKPGPCLKALWSPYLTTSIDRRIRECHIYREASHGWRPSSRPIPPRGPNSSRPPAASQTLNNHSLAHEDQTSPFVWCQKGKLTCQWALSLLWQPRTLCILLSRKGTG